MTAAVQEIWGQAERIAASPLLHSAESLRNLLLFLVRHSLESPLTPLKEHQIAVDVFHRPVDFDPRLDSTVRVQTSRLRAKLTEYYASLGAADAIVLEIPRGSYSVLAHRKDHDTPSASEHDAEVKPVPITFGLSYLWFLFAGLMLFVSGAAAAYFAFRPAQAGTEAIPPSMDQFWSAALHGREKPLVVFSNAEFVGRPETGLRYRNSDSDPSARIFDGYTGVGEVMAVHELTQVFDELHRPFSVKRGRLLNWDDTKDRDLVFIGSPSENLSLRELALGADFRFEKVSDGPRKGDLAILNAHPAEGERAMYLGSASLPISEDYAIVSLFPGPSAPQSILLLAGTTTFGTQGAVEYVCRPAEVQALLRRFSGGQVKPFAGVLKVEMRGGVPIDSKFVAWRLLSTSK